MATTTSRGPGTLTLFYAERDWAKPSNLTRDCFSFRVRARRTSLWGSETVGSHRSHGLPSWHPPLRRHALILIRVASSHPRRVVRCICDMMFTRCRDFWQRGEPKSDQV